MARNEAKASTVSVVVYNQNVANRGTSNSGYFTFSATLLRLLPFGAPLKKCCLKFKSVFFYQKPHLLLI